MDIDIDESDATVPFDAEDTGGTTVAECEVLDVPLANVVVVVAVIVVVDDVAFVLDAVEFTAAAAAVA